MPTELGRKAAKYTGIGAILLVISAIIGVAAVVAGAVLPPPLNLAANAIAILAGVSATIAVIVFLVGAGMGIASLVRDGV